MQDKVAALKRCVDIVEEYQKARDNLTKLAGVLPAQENVITDIVDSLAHARECFDCRGASNEEEKMTSTLVMLGKSLELAKDLESMLSSSDGFSATRH